jgi:methyltransferase
MPATSDVASAVRPIGSVILLSTLFAVAFVPMLVEARRSRKHHAALRAGGAVEPPDDVYSIMQVTYPGAFIAMLGEAWLRGTTVTAITWVGAAVFALAKLLKYWAIATLGPRWTFRVVVPPGSMRTLAGPYRYVRHPNYIGVMGEIVGFALLAGAPVAGVLAAIVFAAVLVARIRVEERALGSR